MRRDLLPALAAFSALSGCLPARDNVRDPKNRPIASLAVVAMTNADGSCATDPDAFDPSDVVVVGIAKRSTCLALDARTSTDPQGISLAEMTFTFGALAGEETIEPFGPTQALVAGSGHAVALLSTSYLATLALDTPILFGVQAEDDEGSRDIAFASLTLKNARPVARLDGGGSVRPRTGATHEMVFDGSRSFDEDGDGLTFCWDFPGDDPEDGCSENDVVSHDVPLDLESRYVVTLEVKDGVTTIPSHPAAVAVRVGTPNIFLVSRQDGIPGALVRRLDSPATFSTFLSRFTAVLPSDRLLLEYEDELEGRAFGISSLPAIGAPPDPLGIDFEDSGPGYAVAMDSSGTIVQIASRGAIDPAAAFGEAPTPTFQLQTFLVDGTSINPTSTRELPDQAELGFGVFNPWTFLLAIDGAGNSWITRRDSEEAAHVVFGAADDDIGLFEMEEDLSLAIRAFSRRPGTSEMWAARAPLGGVLAESDLAVFESVAGTPAVTRRIPLNAGRTAHELAWWSKDLVWIATEEDGVLLAEADLLTGPGGVDAATLLHVPSANLLHHLVVDSATGALWGVGPSGDGVLGLWEIQVDGTTRKHPELDPDSSYEPYPVGFDARGLLVLGGEAGAAKLVHRGLASRNARRQAPFHVPAAVPSFGALSLAGQAAFADPSTGGIWVVADELGSRSLSLYGEDGVRLRRHDRVFSLDLGGLTSPPDLTDARISPDGSTIWFFSQVNPGASYANLNRLDLTANPPTVEAIVLSGGPVLSGGFPNANNTAYGMWVAMRDNEIFEPAAPPDDFVWAQYLDHLYRLNPDGTLVDTGAVLSDPDWASGSLLPSTNSLCVIMRGSLSDPLPFTVQLIAPDGTITPLGAIANVGETTGALPIVGTVGLSDAELGDTCWTIVSQPNGLGWAAEVDAWDVSSPGAPRLTTSGMNTNGPIKSMAAVTRDAVWLSYDEFGSGLTSVSHLPFRADGSYDDNATLGAFPQAELISVGAKNTSSQNF